MEKIDWLTYPHSSGFLIFLLGGWWANLFFPWCIIIYHLLLFAKNRNFLYLLYGCYLISIIGYQFYFLQYQYFPYRNTVLDFLRSQPMIFAELSYLIYFIFTFRFLDIKKDFPRSYTYIIRYTPQSSFIFFWRSGIASHTILFTPTVRTHSYRLMRLPAVQRTLI